jgi:hypothetical protein
MAARLAATTADLGAAIDRWRTAGDPARGGPPQEVTLDALYQQRIYRALSARPALARATIARLPAWLAPQARDTITARREPDDHRVVA